MAKISIGEYTYIDEEVVLRPAYMKSKGKVKYMELNIGKYVYLGKMSIVSAASIGNCVEVGENCVIGQRAVLKDNCVLLPNSVLPSEGIIPPYTVYGGRPAVFVGELPETAQEVNMQNAICRYLRLRKASDKVPVPRHPS